MGRSKRKCRSNTNVEHKPKKVRSDDDDEETTSDSDSDSDKTSDNKNRRNQQTASSRGDNNKNRTIQSREDDESESDDEAPLAILIKRSTNDKMLGVKAIISTKQVKGKTKYLLNWKDGSVSWESKRKAAKVCPSILRQYIEDAKKALEVEAIVSHITKSSKTKYLIKWKDHSKGETWETEFRAKLYCPELVTRYAQEMEMAKRTAIEVEAIVDHKLVHAKHKYLIKWKDHSKGETWETARKTISVCPDILDEFIKERPEAEPPQDYFIPFSWGYKETKDKTKKPRNLFGPKKLPDEDDDDENTEWEVASIVKHRINGEDDWEFLIRWKGCTAKDDTWEAEENLNCPDLLSNYLAEVADGMCKDRRLVMEQTDRNSEQRTVGKRKTDKVTDEDDDENTEWEVASIVKHRINEKDDWEFLIRWKGCTAEDDTWEAEENLNCPDLISKYFAEVADRRPVKEQLTADKRSSKRFVRKSRTVYVDVDDDDADDDDANDD